MEVSLADYPPKYALALMCSRRIAEIDAKPAAERRPIDVLIRLARSEQIAFLLGLDRVSIPRLRPGSIKLKQGGA